MRRVIFLFLDSVGLGDDGPASIPWPPATSPTLHRAAGRAQDRGRHRHVSKRPRPNSSPQTPHMGISDAPKRPARPPSSPASTRRQLGEHYGPRQTRG
ncbi:MAG: hypothetical protein R2851_28660 [Caldilineaceae bacterium]